MNLNKKGFTLIELLVTIVIVGLVICLSTYGIIQFLNNTEEQKITLSESSIKEAARIYSSEANKSSWKDSNDYELFCVTIGELMNKGLLDKNASIENNIDRDSFVVVKRNKITLAIEKEEFAIKDDSNYNICTSQVIVPSENIIKNPEITTPITSYTDKIEIPFIKGSATYNGTPSETSYRCLYGTTSSLINMQGRIEDDKCILEGLKNNTEYYAVVYMDTIHGSTVASGEPKEISTTNFKSPILEQDQHPDLIYITYSSIDDKGGNINSPSYYFRSTVNAKSYEELYECTLNTNIFTCSDEPTKTVVHDTWYKVKTEESNSLVTLDYPEESSAININAKVYDESNNYEEGIGNFEINKHTIKFHKNNALSIGGRTDETIERTCITNKEQNCNITSPTIEAPAGYKIVGWNTDSSVTTSIWDANTSKSIDADRDYYAIITIDDGIINANKFSCEGANRLAVYHVTSCVSDDCIYDTKNGLNNSYDFSLDTTGLPTWAINKSSYVDSVSDKSSITISGNTCNRQLLYVNNSTLNCRSEASTAKGSETIERTWKQCTALYVYRTTMRVDNNHNWFYSSTYDCFLSGQYLSSTKPESCTEESGSTVNYVTYCVGTESACKNALGPLFQNIISSSVYLPEGHICKQETISSAANWKDVKALYTCFPSSGGSVDIDTPGNNGTIIGAN